MKVLSIDIETYSDEKLGNVGVYRYADAPNFQILLFAYSIDGGPVVCVDLTKDTLPKEILEALVDDGVVKSAFNAQFERVCINTYFDLDTGPWECTMLKAWSNGINGGLASVGSAIGLSEDEGKMKEGKRLIKAFCEGEAKPYEGEDWELFKAYCIRDVEVELKIREKLSRFHTTEFEKYLYHLDQKINDRGIRLDKALIDGAITIDRQLVERTTNQYKALTGMENPNSLADIKRFLESVTGEEIPSLRKSDIDPLMKHFENYQEAVEVLRIRKLLSKTSTAKYYKMREIEMKDHRARGIFQFYGATRTGRWAGRLIQAQNLPRNYAKDLETAREVIRLGDLESLEMAYGDAPDILSQCLRTAIIPTEGYKFAVADFSAIEARVVAWFAGEDWVLDVFRTTGKIYEATASKMFHVPLDSVTKGSDMRQRGKVATLALGYQGGAGALVAMGALSMGIPEEDLQDIVDKWRASNPKIVGFWYETQRAVIRAIKTGEWVSFADGKLKASVVSGILRVELPSGRKLAYAKPSLGQNKWGGDSIVFHERSASGKDWLKKETYGGSLVENIVQATARDILAFSMVQLEKEGYPIVMHIHDEVVIEIPKDSEDLDHICDVMGRPPKWARGLPLRADGYECKYYMKD